MGKVHEINRTLLEAQDCSIQSMLSKIPLWLHSFILTAELTELSNRRLRRQEVSDTRTCKSAHPAPEPARQPLPAGGQPHIIDLWAQVSASPATEPDGSGGAA